jgi:methylenetetrahydrofolate reductase (NADPH)
MPRQKLSFSFEIFPPKNTTSLDSILATIDALAPLKPDFMSVTYGAGGSTQGQTVAICSLLENKYHIPAMAHLTCVGATKVSVQALLKQLESAGIQRILALRGDLPKENALGEFRYAADLMKFIKSEGKFYLAGACYPEKHIEAPTLESDLSHLKEKVEAGAEMLISQLFFDNEHFYAWREKARLSGIHIPIVAGIMPVTSASQLERMVTLCGATIPTKVRHFINAYQHQPAALKEAGIAYATMQIIDLLAVGVDGIHLYTMNQADIASRIIANIREIMYDFQK